jgi:hypothetical protein
MAALAWMAFLPAVVGHELRSVTGFDTRVSVLSANPFTGRVLVRGFVARNPPQYPAPDFIELRELRADVNVFSWIFTKRTVINELDLNIEKIEIVRRSDKTTNAGEFASAFSRGGAKAAAPAAPAQPSRYIVKWLRIRLERIVVADYSGSKVDEKKYDLHLDHTYTNVTDMRQLVVPDVVKTLYSFGLHHDFAQLLPGDFGVALGDAFDGVADVGSKLKDAGKKAGSYVKGLFDKLEQSPKP